jgi:hypothetical protein
VGRWPGVEWRCHENWVMEGTLEGTLKGTLKGTLEGRLI